MCLYQLVEASFLVNSCVYELVTGHFNVVLVEYTCVSTLNCMSLLIDSDLGVIQISLLYVLLISLVPFAFECVVVNMFRFQFNMLISCLYL